MNLAPIGGKLKGLATINTLPRAFGAKLLPNNYIPLMLIPTSRPSAPKHGTFEKQQCSSSASSSSTMLMNLDSELTFFHEGVSSEAPPRCYDTPFTREVAFRPYTRPRIFKTYPGKNKPKPTVSAHMSQK